MGDAPSGRVPASAFDPELAKSERRGAGRSKSLHGAAKKKVRQLRLRPWTRGAGSPRIAARSGGAVYFTAWAINVEEQEGEQGMAQGNGKRVSCEACYFRQNMLCALTEPEPCATFRSAERGLAPERQLAFVFRTERTRSVYAFPPPGESSAVR